MIDTNVPVVANGRITNASIECRNAALDFLMSVLANDKVILDLGGEIQSEYRGRLNPSGQPGVGDLFFQTILQSAPSRVERIELLKDPTTGEFIDFPADPNLATFDPDDRKFAAAARKAGVSVSNATDSDWVNHCHTLRANGINVEFICGCDPADWFVDH